jgi:hypothetical protein
MSSRLAWASSLNCSLKVVIDFPYGAIKTIEMLLTNIELTYGYEQVEVNSKD